MQEAATASNHHRGPGDRPTGSQQQTQDPSC